MLLSSSGSPSTPVAQLPPSPAIPGVSGIPAVSVDDTAVSHAKLNGPSHNPFKQLKGGGSSSNSGSSNGGSSAKTEPTPSQTSSGNSSNSGSTGPSGGNGTGTTTTTTTPAAPPPSGLTSTQTYDVAISITANSGNEDTINSLERLSALPSDNTPLLVELGVLRGGKRVLFAVRPGTVVRGGGQCIPGPVDCEILSLGQSQVEKLEAQTQNGVEPQALFAVTAITRQHHATAADANTARRVESSYGRKLLRQSPSTALSLFPYSASLGALVDQRTLRVAGGGN